jgi:hypothetical protein
MTTNPLDDHRGLAVHTTRLIVVMGAVIAVAMLAARRGDALTGLAAGTAVGVADVCLLSRSLSRFDGAAGLNPRALGTGMFTRFLTIGGLLGLVLCVRSLNPLAALVGFLLMPASVAVTGSRFNRRGRAGGAIDALR